MITVYIPTQLRSYTNASQVTAQGETIFTLVDDLERQFPGIRFRMIDEQGHLREHIHIFVNNHTIDGLNHRIHDGDIVRIIGQISGG